ncbi:hypothetical protein E2C01_068736 [Portunus trituberculatus]|uniref:Uncharacterized protein n=1 Tax=Portunus trituberculatus TaxID=210409 RepID=A0A5B7I0B7_PORTR|nr:hypothetical protein [Portunus trituberculatus]
MPKLSSPPFPFLSLPFHKQPKPPHPTFTDPPEMVLMSAGISSAFWCEDPQENTPGILSEEEEEEEEENNTRK